jgi:transposase
MLFVEAKWLYNDILNDIKNRANDTYAKKVKYVTVKTQKKDELRRLKFLSSQMKQSVSTQVKNNLQLLSKIKQKNNKISKLKYKSFINSINLKQFGNTFKIDLEKSKISIQGLKKLIKVNGLNQIEKLALKYNDLEIANAKLLKVDNDYFLNITIYHTDECKLDEILAVDMGIKEQITLSNNIGFQYCINESIKLKKLQKSLSRKKGAKKNEIKSKNFKKNLSLLNKEYRKTINKKINIINHIFYTINQYKYIVIQDEQIKAWYQNKFFSKKIHNTSLGAIKSKIKNLESHRIDILNKFLPTTQMCSCCGKKQHISLNERIYNCPNCNTKLQRDINSTFNMINFSKFSAEHRKTMPLERKSSIFKKLQKVAYLKVRLHSLKEEAQLIAV